MARVSARDFRALSGAWRRHLIGYTSPPTRVGPGLGLFGDPDASCWTAPCHRELQGLGPYINWYPASLSPYTATVVQQAGQDQGTIDIQQQRVILCSTCATLIEKQAEQVAEKRVAAATMQLSVRIGRLEQALAALTSSGSN